MRVSTTRQPYTWSQDKTSWSVQMQQNAVDDAVLQPNTKSRAQKLPHDAGGRVVYSITLIARISAASLLSAAQL